MELPLKDTLTIQTSLTEIKRIHLKGRPKN